MNTGFIQDPPQLKNCYTNNSLLRACLKFFMPKDILRTIEADLEEFGEKVAGPINELGWQAEVERPIHIPYSPWGERIDDIKMSPAWKELDALSAREGLVAIGYERKQGEYSRLYQFAKLFLFHPSSAFYTCPLAMCDGAARVIEVYGDDELKQEAYVHLTSRQPETFWTSGQWMTEKTGGSDVGGTSTVAKPVSDGFELSGIKWFSSATTSQVALGLARIEGEDSEGSAGLSLFYIPMRKKDGSLNGIQINRLKDKLGTKALPTAELTLQGSRAKLIGEKNRGVKTVATMLNITRLYNAICSLGQMDRAIALSMDYSFRREAFGYLLKDHPLHVETLVEQRLQFFSGLILTLQLIHIMGREEVSAASSDEKLLLRLLTPVAKLYTGKMSMAVVSEMVESFGGAGYVEDTRLPVLLRDAQVFPIWEGATNVLSLDVLRVLKKPEAFPAFVNFVKANLSGVSSQTLGASQQKLENELQTLVEYVQNNKDRDDLFWQTGARHLAQSMAKLVSGALMLKMASEDLANEEIVVMAKRWTDRPLVELLYGDERHRADSMALL